MAKSIVTYWNTFQDSSRDKWTPVAGLEEFAEELTLSIDDETGEYTRLTRFKPGTDASAFGAKCHDYPEEIFVLEGSLYDKAFDLWLQAGHYASSPPGEVHGPFRTESGCTVLEISFPNRVS